MTTPAHPHRRRPGRTPAGEDGSISLLLVVAALGLLVAVGLVIDGGQKLRSSQRADDAAAEAARAAVLSTQPGTTVRGLPPQVDEAAARNAAQAHLRRAGVQGTVTVDAGQVQVRTFSRFTPSFLTIIGMGAQTVTGRATARLARGVDREQP